MVYIFSIISAVLFSLAAFIQHRQAQRTPHSTNLRLSLISKLVKRPYWILGVFLDLLAFLAQFVALKLGPLLIVQPILAFGLTSTLLLEAIFGVHKASKRVLALSCISALLLALFLATTTFGSSQRVVSIYVGTSLSAFCVVAFLALRFFGDRLNPTQRGIAMGAAVGTLHGIATFTTKVLTTTVASYGFIGALSKWPIYSLVIIGAIDVILTQSAFQKSSLSVVMPLINVLEPVIAMALGATILAETIRSRLGGFGLLAILGTIALLSVFVSRSASVLVIQADQNQLNS